MLLGSGFFLLVWIALWIAGFVDALTSDPERVRHLPKAVWVVLILLFSGFASIAWFIFGRPRGPGVPGSRGIGGMRGLGSSSGGGGFGYNRPAAPARQEDPAPTGWQLGGAGAGRRSGPVAPDDDPDFLRQLGKRRRDEPPGGAAGGKPDQPA